MRTIKQLIVHCSAVRAGIGQTVGDIRRDHLQRGWRDIGYHFVIEDDGNVQRGRPVAQVGAHAKGNNRFSIGICYTGGLATYGNGLSGPNQAQQAALRSLLNTLRHVFPDAEILGHRDTGAKKDCPCFDVRDWYATGKLVVSRNLA